MRDEKYFEDKIESAGLAGLGDIEAEIDRSSLPAGVKARLKSLIATRRKKLTETPPPEPKEYKPYKPR